MTETRQRISQMMGITEDPDHLQRQAVHDAVVQHALHATSVCRERDGRFVWLTPQETLAQLPPGALEEASPQAWGRFEVRDGHLVPLEPLPKQFREGDRVILPLLVKRDAT